mgnify:CR=1 FL=1
MHLVIHIPDFELQSRLRDEPGMCDQPVALLDEMPSSKRQKDKHRIVQLTAAAIAANVEIGMTATQGLARCADLKIFNRDAAREHSAQEALLQYASGLSPRIESTAPGICTVDLRGTVYERAATVARVSKRHLDLLRPDNAMSVSPSPQPSPPGEGAEIPVPETRPLGLQKPNGHGHVPPSHEPDGARVCDPQQLRQTYRGQDQRERLRVRCLLRLTEPRSGSGVQSANSSAKSLPEGEGRGEGGDRVDMAEEREPGFRLQEEKQRNAPKICADVRLDNNLNWQPLQQLAQNCLDALIRLNLRTRIGIAPNPDLALLAARFATPIRILGTGKKDVQSFLNPLPVSALNPSDDTLKVLKGWGIKTLKQLTALPQQEVIERLGRELIPLWQLARGGKDRSLKLHEAALTLTEAADLEHHIERLEALIFILNRFLEQIAIRLAEVYLVAESLTLKLKFEDGKDYERTFRIPEPTRDTALLLRTLHTFLENFKAASAVTGVSLSAQPAHASERQLDLFQASLRDPNQFAETLARLEALLGPNRIGSPVVEPSHRADAVHLTDFDPDDTGRKRRSDTFRGSENPLTRPSASALRASADISGTLSPTGGEGRGEGDSDNTGAFQSDKPISNPAQKAPPRFGLSLRRFRPPLPIQVKVRKNAKDEILLRIDSREINGRIRDSKGPWKLSGDWWDTNREWAREEWDVELERGGVIRLAREADEWILDGVYD